MSEHCSIEWTDATWNPVRGWLRDLLRGSLRFAADLPHVWWGVSVENQRHGLPRIENLRRAPAAVRFLSVEPLLEDLGTLDLEGISWVIVGGESGPGARPMEPEWVLSIREQCQAAIIPFFFKQWGDVRKKQAGRTTAGPTDEGGPEPETAPVPRPRDALELFVD